ncbi:MAG: arylesterase [Rhodospirillaceae bacterium]|nr:arylesterase [Rhodospirillaceae bacterium]
MWLLLPSGPAAADTVRILALGDSLTAGYGLAAEDGFVAQLQAALLEVGHDVEVIDAGVSGDTTAGGLARLDWALAAGADAAIVELGANDALRGIDPASSRANLDGILSALGDLGLPVLLAGMLAPRNLGSDYVVAFDDMYPELAAEHDAIFYPFFLEGVAAQPSLNQSDGIHPNPEGVAIIVEAMLPDVIALVERAQATP